MKGREAINDYIIDKVNGIMIYTARLNVNNFPELKENFLVQTYNAKLRFEKSGLIIKHNDFAI